MARTSPRKPRPLPDGIEERTDHEIIEFLFGKKAAAELERLAGITPQERS